MNRVLRHPDSNGSGDAANLDRYLDGLLDDAERAAFERAMMRDPALRELVDLQRSMDGAIRREFMPEVAPVVAVNGRAAIAKAKAPARFSWIRVSAVAAVAAIVTIGGYLYTTSGGRSPNLPKPDPIAIYRAEVERGMKPYEVCTTDQAFAEYTKKQFGTALRIKSIDGLALIGWNYGRDVLGPRTVILLAKVHDKPVVIFMDRIENARRYSAARPPLASGTARVGNVTLLEVRGQDAPCLLGQFEVVP